MKIYTKTGDDGTTGLWGGGRVPKYHSRMEVVGHLDELNSILGLVRTELISICNNINDPIALDTIANAIAQIQPDLFIIGAQFAASKTPKIQLTIEAVTRLENWIDTADAILPVLQTFILPGGSRPAAQLHIARAICRRTERAAWQLQAQLESSEIQVGNKISNEVLIYLNRLSDLCFVWARCVNMLLNISETPWIIN